MAVNHKLFLQASKTTEICQLLSMIEVFKTNITCTTTAASLMDELRLLYPYAAINFDLDDCDNILRIKGDNIHPHIVIAHLEGKGHECIILE